MYSTEVAFLLPWYFYLECVLEINPTLYPINLKAERGIKFF